MLSVFYFKSPRLLDDNFVHAQSFGRMERGTESLGLIGGARRDDLIEVIQGLEGIPSVRFDNLQIPGLRDDLLRRSQLDPPGLELLLTIISD